MNFGKWILVAFILFALFIGALVTVCVRQEVSLVSKNYYQEELNHQTKMNRIENANQLSQVPLFQFDQGSLNVLFPEWKEVETGKLVIMRPSNAKLDLQFDVKSSADSIQRFPMAKWERGLYRVNFTWTMHGKEYYCEKMISL